MVKALEAVPAEVDSRDAVGDVLRRLRTRMRLASAADPLHVEFLEDDLREGQKAIGDIEDYLGHVIDLLDRSDARPRDLVDLADDSAVLERLDYLAHVVGNVRRRLMQIAVRSCN